MAEGVEGLARDKTRKPGKPPLPPDTVRRVVDQALGPPPGEATHWTGHEGGRGEFAVSAAHPCGPAFAPLPPTTLALTDSSRHFFSHSLPRAVHKVWITKRPRAFTFAF